MDRVIKEVARVLRKNLTPAEKTLWTHLWQGHLDGFKFRRQQPLGRFIADFICFEKRLIIEVDGEVHASQEKRDGERDRYLEESGFKVLRFLNAEVEQDIGNVLSKISLNLNASVPDLPKKWKRRDK